jgi:P2 family phage contractile tail tube protein
MKVTTLTNGNLYMNGTSRAGTVDSIKLPDLMQKTQDLMPLGMIGTHQVPTGFEPFELTMQVSAYNDEFMRAVCNPYVSTNLQVRGEIQEHNANGTTTTRAYACMITGRAKGVTLGEFKAHELVKQEVTFICSAIEMKIDNVEQFAINLLTSVHRINGVDVKGNYRNTLGLNP